MGKGEGWGYRTNGVTNIGTSTGDTKWKFITIECGLKPDNAKAYEN